MGRKNNKKKAKKSFFNKLIKVFAFEPYTPLNYKQVASRMGITDKASRTLVATIMDELVDQNILKEVKRGKYLLHPSYITAQQLSSSYITGIVDMKQTGKAYIITDDVEEDVYIAAGNTKHSLDGDRVKVHLFPRRRGRKLEGQITEVLERKMTQFVGTIEHSKKFAFLLPDNPSVPVDIFIPIDKLKGAKNGQKAIATITDWPEHANNPFGKIVTVLGDPGVNDVEMDAILASFDFPLCFPDKVENAADDIPETISKEEIAKRKDYRNILTFTIDPYDAKDFDDAISYRKLDNGNFELGVHIADVSHYVKPGSPIDNEAFIRATSVYLVDRVIPMLPEKLSNKVCSLRPDEEKCCFSAIFEMDECAKVKKEWFGRTVIKSDRRFTYEEAQDILEGASGDLEEELRFLNEIAKKLRKDRFDKGSIAFRSEEVKFHLDDKGKPISTFIKVQKDAHMLIEDFMLLANKKVAERIGIKRGKAEPKTFVYRIHDEPTPTKLATFVEFVRKLGYDMKTGSRRSLVDSFNKLFKDVQGKGEQNLVETVSVRTMAKAIYSTKNIGHYGLGFKYYTHFTSPIRRYPDLIVHRLLEEYLTGGKSVNANEFEEKCEHCSDMEKRAADAERASVKYKQAEFLLDKVGDEFEGQVSGVSKWGIYVELLNSKCEGMVNLHDMTDDFYHLDEENYRVIGQRYKHEIRLGDRVRIRVKNVDLARKQMDFELLDH